MPLHLLWRRHNKTVGLYIPRPGTVSYRSSRNEEQVEPISRSRSRSRSRSGQGQGQGQGQCQVVKEHAEMTSPLLGDDSSQ